MTSKNLISSLAMTLALSAGGCASDDAPADSDGDGTSGGMETDSGSDPTGDPSSGDPTGNPTSDGSTSGDPTSDGSTGDDPTSDGTTSGDPTSDGSTGEPIDDEPPSIVSVSPEDGEIGVMHDAEIVITFSEPMDKVATQAAYQSADIPAASVTMTWNEDGDVLTITPNEELALGEGFDPDTVEALTYQFTMTTAATDLAGNELEQDEVVEFATTRLILQQLPALGAWSGCIRADGFTAFAYMSVGDSGDAENAQYKGVMSYEISNLPDGIQMFVAAEMRLYQDFVNGEPYGVDNLGNLMAYDLEFTAMDLSTFSAPALAEVGLMSDSPDLGIRALDVTSFVAEDYDANQDATQFRLEFEDATDFDESPDLARFETTEDNPASLVVLYTIP